MKLYTVFLLAAGLLLATSMIPLASAQEEVATDRGFFGGIYDFFFGPREYPHPHPHPHPTAEEKIVEGKEDVRIAKERIIQRTQEKGKIKNLSSLMTN